MAQTPMVRWAQRKDNVVFSIELPEVTDDKVTLEGNNFHFEGKSQGKDYKLDFTFNKDVTQEVRKKRNDQFSFVLIMGQGSAWAKHGKSYNFCIHKKQEGFWPRLTTGNAKQSVCSSLFKLIVSLSFLISFSG